MSSKTAFFAVARKYLEDPEWTAEPFTKAQAWLDLIGRASYKDGPVTKRGQLATSERALADRWRWPKTKVRRFLEKLEKEGRITRTSNRTANRTTNWTTINVEKYEVYQTARTTERTTNRTTERTDYNNIDNINNLSNMPTGTIEALKDRYKERAEALIEDVRNYYTAHPEKEFPGWPIAVVQFDNNQQRWGKKKKKRSSLEEGFAAFEEGIKNDSSRS